MKFHYKYIILKYGDFLSDADNDNRSHTASFWDRFKTERKMIGLHIKNSKKTINRTGYKQLAKV